MAIKVPKPGGNRIVAKKSVEAVFTTSDIVWPSYSMLLYGLPGAGKTHFIGTVSLVEEMNKVLVIDNDGGSLTLCSHPDFKGIHIIKMTAYQPYEALMNWLLGVKNADTKPYYDNLGPSTDYKTIAIDNIGKWHLYVRQHLIKNEDFNRPHKDVVSLMDYKVASILVNNFLTVLHKHAVKHNTTIILTAHIQENFEGQGELRRLVSKTPMIPGQLSQTITGDFPLVGYMERTASRKAGPVNISKPADEDKFTEQYSAYFLPFDNYNNLIKNRHHNDIGKLSNPTFSKVLDKLK